jgi:ribosome-associated translation inhibitor RaiA
MRRLAFLLLAGATLVAAQTSVDTSKMKWKIAPIDTSKHKMMPPDTMKHSTMPILKDTMMHKMMPPCSTMHSRKDIGPDSGKAQFQDKMRDAFDKARIMADSARHTAIEFHKQMMGKDSAEVKQLFAKHQADVQAKLQKAIDAIDKTLAKLTTQVDKASERAQSRLEQKKQELIKLQDRIKAHQAATKTAPSN